MQWLARPRMTAAIKHKADELERFGVRAAAPWKSSLSDLEDEQSLRTGA